jgi:TrmH family RNA methyltransferase
MHDENMNKVTKSELRKTRQLMRDKKERDDSGLFVVEGMKIIRDLCRKGHEPEQILVSTDFARASQSVPLLDEFEDQSVKLAVVGNPDFERISSLKSSQGILGIFRKPRVAASILTGDKNKLVIMCDGIQDPGNLGTMIRTAAAFGADAVLITGETVDIYNPKVIRASGGAVLDVPVQVCEKEEIGRLKKEGFRLLVSMAEAEKGKDISEIGDLSGPLIVAFGSEGRGISAEISEMADVFFHIPIDEDVESLNVMAAAAITLYVFAGKRRAGY